MEPTAAQLQLRPGGQRPAVVRAPELDPGARASLVQPQLRAAAVPEVDPQVGVLAAVLSPHRRPDPLAAGELRRGDLDLGVLVTGVRLSDPDVTREAAARIRPPPATTIDNPPSLDRGPVRTQTTIRPVEIIRAGGRRS